MRLRELRKTKGITMKALGKEIGVSESTISLYETGKREPDFETLLKLGDYFGVSTDYLLGKNTKKEPAPVSQGGHSKTALAFAERFKDFTPEEWKKLREYADFLKSTRNKKEPE